MKWRLLSSGQSVNRFFSYLEKEIRKWQMIRRKLLRQPYLQNSSSHRRKCYRVCVHARHSGHEKRSCTKNQRLHGKRRITTRNEQKRARRPPEMLRQAANSLFRRFPLRIPVWVAFGSNGKCAEFSIGKSSENAEKSGRNQQISAGFGRSVGIRTRGLLVPKVGRIFLADISRHFRTFLLRKFRSFVVSSTDNST